MFAPIRRRIGFCDMRGSRSVVGFGPTHVNIAQLDVGNPRIEVPAALGGALDAKPVGSCRWPSKGVFKTWPLLTTRLDHPS